MTISYPLALPTATGFKSRIITPESAVAIIESPWTLNPEVQENQGQRWLFDVQLPIMNGDDAAEWEAFFLSLNGRAGTFLMGDPLRAVARGVATGSPQVNGGSQSGQSLITDGWTSGVTNILKKGDWIQIGTGSTARLYRQLVDLNSDGSGNATLTLWPNITLSNSPADNAPLTVASTKGVFRLSDENVPFSADTAQLSTYSFRAVSEV